MKFRYLTAALALTAMAACTNEEFASYESDPNAVRISATVGSLNEARSNPIGDNTTGFNLNDRISITSNDKTVVYKLTDSEGWSPESDYLTWGSEEEQLFTAHYPADWDGETLSVESDQSGLTNLQLSDRMSFSQTFTKQESINLTMERKTARVVVSNEITWNDEYKDADGNATREVKEIKINGIVPFQHKEETATDKNYYALLVPTSADRTGIFMTITIGDIGAETNQETLTITGIPDLTAAHSYTYSLTIGKKKASIGSVTVEDWTTGNILNDNGIAEEHLGYTVVTDPNGTKTYMVEDAFGLMAVNRIMTSDVDELSSNITLTADITLTGENNWTPIGTDWSKPYKGKFDGNGKSITGLVVNSSTAFAGLIGYLSYGTVTNLTLYSPHITTTGDNAGGIVGLIGSESSVIACAVYGGTISGGKYAGGITGSINGSITACMANGVIVKGETAVGGISGSIGSGATLTANFAYQCIDGSTSAALSGGLNIGETTYSTSVDAACYYVAYETTDIYSWTDTTTPVGEWSTAKEAMNKALTDQGYAYEWTGDSAEEAKIETKTN